MLDETNYMLTYKDKRILLNKGETIILKSLMENKKGVASLESLCNKIYGDVDSYYICALQTRISRLRKKLPREIKIKVRYQIGYYIEIKE